MTALGAPIATILADGGPTTNTTLMQLQADTSGRDVAASRVAELSALGAAHVARLYPVGAGAGHVDLDLEARLGGGHVHARGLDAVHAGDHPPHAVRLAAQHILVRAVEAHHEGPVGAREHVHATRGLVLPAREAAHVAQQRGAPDSGPLIVTQPGDAYEREAEAVARGLGL